LSLSVILSRHGEAGDARTAVAVTTIAKTSFFLELWAVWCPEYFWVCLGSAGTTQCRAACVTRQQRGVAIARAHKVPRPHWANLMGRRSYRTDGLRIAPLALEIQPSTFKEIFDN